VTDTCAFLLYDRLGEEAGRTELRDQSARGGFSGRVRLEEARVEVSVAGNRGADVARVDGFTALHQPRDPPRLEELREQLGLGRLLDRVLRDRQPAGGHHPLDELVQL